MTLATNLTANLLRTSARAYAAAVVDQMQKDHGATLQNGLPRTFAQPIDDTEVRILHLAESVTFDRPELLQHAVNWYKVAFHHRGVAPEYLSENLAAMAKVLRRELPPTGAAVVVRHLESALAGLDAAPVDLPSALSTSAPHGDLAARFLLAVLEGRGDDAAQMARDAAAAGLPVEELHDHVLTPVQREMGRMWLMAEVPIADEHYGSAIVDRVLWALADHLPRPAADAPVVLTMGVGGNLHDFGLRMVAQRLVLAGFRVHHLGSNMPVSDLEWALQERGVDLVAIAATMILHLSTLAATVADVRRIERLRGTARQAPVLVGGEVFGRVPDLHLAVGADAYAVDAASAVARARQLLVR